VLRGVYVCCRDKTDYGGAECQQLAGGCVDAYVRGLSVWLCNCPMWSN
jgi:hypothetical protein